MSSSVLAVAQILVSFFIIVACIIIGILMIKHSIRIQSRSQRIKAYFVIIGGFVFGTGLFWPAIAHLYTEYLWFQHLNYASVFLKILFTRWWLFLMFAGIAAGFLGLNLLIANALCPVSREFRRWTRRRNLMVNLSAIAIILILSGAMGVPMMWLWEEYLLYRNQVTVGENEISTVEIDSGDVTAIMTGQARPRGLAFDENDNLYVAGSDQVFTFNPDTKIFATVASELSGPRGLAFDYTNGVLYVVESDTGEITEINLNTSPITVVPDIINKDLSRPMSIAYRDGVLYVAEADSGEISKISDLKTGEVTTLAKGLSRPMSIAFDQTGDLYVAETESGEISKVDVETGEVTPWVGDLNHPVNLTFGPDGMLYVAGMDSIYTIDPTSTDPNTTKSLLSAGLFRPMSLAFKNKKANEKEVTFKITEQSLENLSSEGVPNDVLNDLDSIKDQQFTGEDKFLDILNKTIGQLKNVEFKSLILEYAEKNEKESEKGKLYVAEWGRGQISTVDVENGNVTRLKTEFSRSVDIVFDQNSTMYVASDDEVFKVNEATGDFMRLAEKISHLGGLAYNKNENVLYVTSGNSIFRVDPNSGEYLQIAKGLSQPRGMAFDQRNNILYVAEFNSNKIIRIRDLSGRGDLKNVSETVILPKKERTQKAQEVLKKILREDEILSKKERKRRVEGILNAVLKGHESLQSESKRSRKKRKWLIEKFKSGVDMFNESVLAKENANRPLPDRMTEDELQRFKNIPSDDKEVLRSLSESPQNQRKRQQNKRRWLTQRFERGVNMFNKSVLEKENMQRARPDQLTVDEQNRLLNTSDDDRELLRSLEDLDRPMALALNRDGRYLYVVEWRIGAISKVNVENGIITKVAKGLSSPKDIILGEDGKELYVAESGSGEISAINPSTGSRKIVTSGLSSPTSLALTTRVRGDLEGNEELYIAESVDTDPFFNKEIGYYLFTLPFYKWVSIWAKVLMWITIIFTAWIYNYYYSRDPHTMKRARNAMFIHGTVFWIMLAGISYWRSKINTFQLLLHQRGGIWPSKVYGIGAADAQQVLAYKIFMLIVIGIAIVVLANAFWRKRWLWYAGATIWLASYVLIVWLYPNLYQRFRVTPTEREIEIPYLKHNINGTRKAYSLDKIKEHRFVKSIASVDLIRSHPEILSNIQMWDRHVLYKILKELESYREYYDFYTDADVDRYWVDGKYRQVMLAAREIYPEGLPTQNWINNQFVYTHGYGVSLIPVNEKTPEGKPIMWLGGIQPKSEPPGSPVYDYHELKITRPEIYYGEITKDFVFINTASEEFDYPQLSEAVGLEGNKYTRYDGSGGIPLGKGFRRYSFYWRFAKLNILLTRYLRDDSKVMFRRRIDERAKTAAPILKFDRDPFIVIGNSGRLWWVIDTYVTNSNYPYSEAHQHPKYGKFNYIRNAAVAITDAYNGDVNFYILDEHEPLIRTYRKIFPDLFKPKEDIPDGVASHLRFPDTFTYILAQKYTDYHVQNPVQFYDKSDSWNLPRETYYDDKSGTNIRIPMKPYYATLTLPGESKAEFVNMLPFTPPKRTLNMSAWLVARCDPPHYGEMVVYALPKGVSIDGPEQIEERIDAHPQISKDHSLWGQGDSRVLRGNLLVIPVENSLFYVEPVFLQSKKLPLLKQIIVAAEDKLAGEGTFDEALEKLFLVETPATGPGGLMQQGLNKLSDAKKSLSEGDIEKAQREIEEAVAIFATANDKVQQYKKPTEELLGSRVTSE
ncbi:MAG: UPF0182 family protein [Candidatus Poribacteria bacterium]